MSGVGFSMHGTELVDHECFAAVREGRLVPECNADPGPAGKESGIAVTRALEKFLGDGLSAHRRQHWTLSTVAELFEASSRT